MLYEVITISGDSDFSPLVSKLRENAKRVIGVGVKQSCSDLLVTNCDEFIYYDDLVRDREASRSGPRREREKRSPEEEAKRRQKAEERQAKAVELVAATFADLMADRGEAERIWASVLKEVVKRVITSYSIHYTKLYEAKINCLISRPNFSNYDDSPAIGYHPIRDRGVPQASYNFV